MADLKRQTPNAAASQLASLLMAARPQGHIYHLQSTIYAEHLILDEFYKGIGKIADKTIEAYQGQFGIVRNYKFESMREDNLPLAYLKELRQRITALRYEAIPKENTGLQSELDEAIAFLDGIIYKLVNLK